MSFRASSTDCRSNAKLPQGESRKLSLADPEAPRRHPAFGGRD
jgi:hypothetical protein